ncbi:condensation domain-containing protein [Microbulbifer sp. 2201CG32-9]|uniref:condensation domain-containing protein n=1 Tax=Microbulbifer sp. 2201CG32-9 TaxID=3232309 RepID=UPI00345BC304
MTENDVSTLSGSVKQYPATVFQHQAWATEQIAAVHGWPSFLLKRVVPYRNLDDELIAEALQILFNLHSVFRSTIHARDDGVIQRVHPQVQVDLLSNAIDLRKSSDKSLILNALIDAQASQRLPLGELPHFLIALIRDAEANRLLLHIDHLCVDARSLDLLIQQLQTICQALVQGKNQRIDALKPSVDYTDYAVWEAEELSSNNISAPRKYWRQLLATSELAFDPLWQLTGRDPRPAISYADRFADGCRRLQSQLDRRFQNLAFGYVREIFPSSGAVEKYSFFFHGQVFEHLKKWSKQNGFLFSNVVMSGLALWVHKMSGLHNFIVTMLSDTRLSEKFFDVVGCFAMEVPVLCQLRDREKFADLCGRLQEQLSESYQYRLYPMTLLLADLDIDYSCLRTIQVNYINLSSQEGHNYSPEMGLGGIADRGIHMRLVEYKNGLSVECEYLKELFEASQFADLIQQYPLLMAALMADSEQIISALPD